MECISISFKSAPEEVRKCFVFSEEEKRKILEQTSQAVVLNTCNRTEIYVTGGENSFSLLERLLADKSGMEETQLRRISSMRYDYACSIPEMLLLQITEKVQDTHLHQSFPSGKPKLTPQVSHQIQNY